MYHIKMAFTVIQVATNLWVNPVQIQGVAASPNKANPECLTIVLLTSQPFCSDWPIEKVKAALSPAAVSKAMEAK